MELILDPQAQGSASAPSSTAATLKDVTLDSFTQDVMEASTEMPVVLQFYAPNSPQCAEMTAQLAKIAKQAAGQVSVVRMDLTDPNNQQLAMQLRVQSVPTVFAFAGGRPVDGFAGPLPEDHLRGFFEKLIGGPIENPVTEVLEQAAAALAGDDAYGALTLFQQVLGREPTNPDALAGVLRALLKLGEVDQARATADSLDPKLKEETAIAAAISAIELAEQVAGGADTAELDSRLAADADDHQARFDRAMARFAADDRDGAVEDLVEIVRRDRAWNEEAARTQLLKFFEAWGPMDPASVAGRRRLSAVLFS